MDRTINETTKKNLNNLKIGKSINIKFNILSEKQNILLMKYINKKARRLLIKDSQKGGLSEGMSNGERYLYFSPSERQVIFQIKKKLKKISKAMEEKEQIQAYLDFVD